ncbi:protocadherin-16 isoform X2 [Carettochelys insculpta]|uniref:protocadherin-16 isoform X2 n=1 Tax=Carettochelys insculpta TaxID=44489 RepID=UPI003EB69C5E
MGCLKRSAQLLLHLLLLGGLRPGQGSTVLGTLDLQIDEEQPAGTIIGDVSAGLPPSTTAYMYFISAQEGSGVSTDLEIDENTGIIKTARVLDRESRDRYSFIAVTPDGITVEVNIQVNDINDHAPVFPKRHRTFQIPEHTPISSRFPLDPAFDADSGLLNTQGYMLKGENVGQAFRLETRRGPNGVLYLDLVVSNILDRENCSSYSLLLEAYDGGSPPRSSQMTLDVAIQDINDNAPAFNQSRYHTLISENLKPGSSILQVFASDADEGDNGAVVYEINRRQSDPEQYFTIDSRTGVIKLNKGLDYEMRKVHELVVQARDKAVHPEVTTAFVTIHVRDYNDNQPTMTIIFLSEDGSPQISEGAQPGQYVARISVSDPDYGEYSNVNVSLEGGDGKFALTTKDNIIYLICVDKLLDREERDSYDLRVMATDSGTPPLRAESAFVLQVMDVNDNPPLFDQQEYKQSIPEVVYPGSFVLQVTARDKDQGPNGDVQYSILHNQDTHSNWFTIDPTTGIITTAAPLDYEKDPQPQLTVLAIDGGMPVLSSTTVVYVALQDVNDNEPVFRSNFYNVSLKENTPSGTCFLQITATDADSGPFGSLSYSIGSGIGTVVPTQFSIDEHTGQLCTVQDLDRDEGATAYDFTVTAVDGGGLNSMVYVKVFLEDVNDNQPSFYPLEYAASISTQSMPGTAVLRVTAQDKDEGPNGKVTYHIVSGNSPPLFSLHKDTGVVSLSWSLSGKANTLVQLVISAQDGGGLSTQPNAQVNISIVAGTVSPPVFEQAQYFFTVPEDTQQGASIGAVRAHNPPGHSDDIFYSISSGDPHGYFCMDSSLGQLHISLPLDHEVQAALVLDVQARSGSPPAYSNAQVKISVSDVNDNEPVFLAPSDSILLLETTELGSTVYMLQAEDQDGGANGQVHFELVSGGDGIFSVERSSGTVRLVGALQYEASAAYGLTIVARDGGVPQLSSTFTLLVHVQAEHDHGPIFDTLTYRVEVREGTPVSTRFLQVRALGQDAGATPLTYHLRADGDAASFGIVPESGWLYVKSALDRETRDLYMLTVLASAGTGSTSSEVRKTGTSTVRVSITDENDNSPRLSEERYFFTIPENQAPGSRVGRVTASDRDTGQNSRLTYRLLQHDPNFLIHLQSGDLTTKRSLDREQQSSYQMLVIVQDGGTPPRSVTGTIYVTVLDENDNVPTFLHMLGGRELLVQVLEEKPSGLLITSMQAKDPDEGENGTIFYSLTGAWAERFTLHMATGELRTATVLRRTDRAEYIFTVTASDRGTVPHSTSAVVRIQVLPSSQLLPQPDTTVLTLQPVEGVRPGSVIGSVAPLEDTVRGQLTYTLVGGGGDGTFVVDSVTGEIYAARELDYEVGAQHTLHVSAEDMQNGYPASRLVLVQIHVQDCNDQAPAFPEDPTTIVVSENTQVGASIFTFQAPDGDGTGPNSQVCYRLLRQEPPGSHFQLNGHSGQLSLHEALDREAAPSFLLVVEATDQARNISQRHSVAITARIFVTDENDNTPVFLSPATVSVMEDQPTGFVVLNVVAQDGDLGENGRVSYMLQAGNTEGWFHLNPSTGALSIVRALNREEMAQHNLTVVAMDHGFPRRSSTQLLSVLVLDVNDEVPTFEKAEYEASVMENLPAGSPVLQLLATDGDVGANGHVSYGGLFGGPFSIHPETGLITTTRSLDREKREQHILTVYARDGGLPSNLAKVMVRILVGDENDHAPLFESKTCSLVVPENQSRVVLYTLRATDPDTGENGRLEYVVMGTVVVSIQAIHSGGSSGRITYSIVSGNEKNAFVIQPSSGAISVQDSRSLDFESSPRLRLVVQAETDASFCFMAVNLNLQDVNDNLPRFQLQNYVAFIWESQSYDSPVIQVLANDPDQGANGQVTYAINQSLPMNGLYHIDAQLGTITTAAILDREIWSQTRLVVTAMDRGNPPLIGSATLTVVVMDINDNSPTIPLLREVRVPENTLLGTEITQVTGNDVDSGPALSYTLGPDGDTTGTFSILRYGGHIALTRPLDYEQCNHYILSIRSSDSRHETEANLTVIVEDINDNAPTFSQGFYQVTLLEHTPAGSTILTVSAMDRDSGSNGELTYRLAVPNSDISINPNNGTLFTSRQLELDADQPTLDLVVEVHDHGSPSLSAWATVQIQVLDMNDHSPAFQQAHYNACVPEDLRPGTTILTLEAGDADLSRENAGFDYTIVSGNSGNAFQVESRVGWSQGHLRTQGALVLVEELDFEAIQDYSLTVAASDRGVPQRSATVPVFVTVLDINDNPPVFARAEYHTAVSENTPPGTELLRMVAHDADSGPHGQVHYTISSGNQHRLFQMHEATGALRLAQPLDRETQALHNLVVQASDGPRGHFALVPLTVEVKDINDNMPYFPVETLSASVRENLPPGTLVTTLHAIDADTGAFGELRYDMLEYGELGALEGRDVFLINRTSGELRSRLTFDYERTKAFQLLVQAMDAGNASATVTVKVLVTGEDEYTPVFLSPDFNFEVPEGAHKGQSIGRVLATDEDEGVDGVVLYSLAKPSPYFGVNQTTGTIYLRMDSQLQPAGQAKREPREMSLEVQARSPLPSSRSASAQVTIDITHTSFGLAPDLNLLLVVAVAASLGVVVVLAAVAIILVLIRSRNQQGHKKPEQDAQLNHKQSGSLQKLGNEDPVLPSSDHIYHQALPGFGSESAGPYPRGGSLDPSHSSGRGSAEAAEDDEIRMINEYPRVASITSSMQEHISARGPDSGIQQDADQLSDVSCEPTALESAQWFKSKKASSLLLPGQPPQLYREDGGGSTFLGVGCGLSVSSHAKDYAFPEDGKPSVEGSLTAVVASEEELRGSYNWDYLLNWCPQFQPLASVFTEIARLKDEGSLRKPFQAKPKTEPKSRIDPPPLITSVAHPGAKSVPPKPAVGRTFPHLSSLRRSPISHEGSISSSAMSPSFSPSLSPLAARSPVVSPFGVSQGPSASVISTEHSLELPEEAELRI